MPKSENDGSLIFPHHLQRETKARLERKEVGVGEAASLAREEVYSGKALQREDFSTLWHHLSLSHFTLCPELLASLVYEEPCERQRFDESSPRSTHPRFPKMTQHFASL